MARPVNFLLSLKSGLRKLAVEPTLLRCARVLTKCMAHLSLRQLFFGIVSRATACDSSISNWIAAGCFLLSDIRDESRLRIILRASQNSSSGLY